MMAQALFGERLVAFNFLPSRTLHPTRHARHGAPAVALPANMAPAWHRHWSHAILRSLDLADRPVRDAARPELALALLPPDRLARLARFAGAALSAQRLRRAISGSEVRQLMTDLGADVIDFARQSPAAPAIAEHDALEMPVTASAIDQLGRAALMGAMSEAGSELMLRAELKLPDGPTDDPPCTPTACLTLALDVLKLTEPTWHSSFLTMR